MLYTYDTKRIKFNRIKFHHYIIFGLLPILLFVMAGYLYGCKIGFDMGIEKISDEEKLILIETMNPFDENKLKDMMIELGIKFPYIVYAQSMLETNGWKSPIFLENHNLFGMKVSSHRVSTARGSSRGHAYYDTWRESVYDYAFYQSRYLGKITNENEYFSYLSASYAEDTLYVDKLKKLIDNEKLREKFK